MSKQNIVLFALTGIGNTVLKALIAIGYKPILIVTRQEQGKFPYYEEKQLVIEANHFGIPVLYGEQGEKAVVELSPDILFVATYHRLIPKSVIVSAKLAFNLHPSLLPLYPGKNPFYWVLINRERFTGITIHKLTEEFDKGEIIFQKKIIIKPNETQGSLRFALAQLAGEIIKEFVLQLDKNNKFLSTDNEKKLINYGQITAAERLINLQDYSESIYCQVRALTPWPLAIIKELDCLVNKILAIDYNINENMKSGSILFVDKTLTKIRVADAEMTFSIMSMV